MFSRGGTSFGVQVFGTMDPDPEHRVSLRNGPSTSADLPDIDIALRYDTKARVTMANARQRLVDVLARGGISARGPADSELHLRPGESVHYGGSVRMHADLRQGMVDGYGRLHAVPNVHVVDSSVFTTCPEKNPTLTAMAIAARSMEPLID